MAVRDEVVRLSLEDAGFSTGTAKATAEVALLNRELKATDGAGLSGSRGIDRMGAASARAKRPIGDAAVQTDRLGQSIDDAGNKAKKSERALDSYSGRIGLLGATIGAVGPSLGPLLAVGGAGLAGLANDMGMAALAGGSLVAALHGVGGTLQAVNKAYLDPSAANIKAAELAMKKATPEARAFVMQLHELMPLLKKMQGSAQAGWFPGLTKAIHDLEPLAPTIEKILGDVGKRGGELLAQGAQSLAGSRWRDFFKFVDTEAPQAMSAMAHVVGSLTHGLAELWMAFRPLDTDVNRSLERGAKAFDRWATGLNKTAQGSKDMESFLAYMHETGPQVGDALVAIGDAVVQIIEAMAPLGGPTLKIITDLSHAIAAIADSPLGTPIMALAQLAGVLSLLNKAAIPLQKNLGMGSGKGLLGGLAFGPDLARAKAGLKDIRAGYTEIAALGGGPLTVFNKTARTSSEEAERLGRGMGVVAGQALRALGPIAGMTLAQSHFVKQQGLSNTVMYAGLGMMAGPWGAAAGATIGLLQDISSGSAQVTSSVKAMDTTFSTSSSTLRDQAKALADVHQSIKDTYSDPSIGTALQYGFQGLLGKQTTVSKSYDDQLAKLKELQHSAAAFATIAASMKVDVGGLGLSPDGSVGKGVLDFADRLGPAMDKAGVSVEDLGNTFHAAFGPGATAQTQQAWTDLVGKITTTVAYMDSDKGKIDSFAQAMRKLSDPTYTAAQSADALASSLGDLFDPKINASAATDGWIKAAQALKGLKDSAGFQFKGVGTSAATLQNRSLVRDYVTSIKERITAAAAAGASEQRLAHILLGSQQVLRSNGRAAAEYGRQLGLTPKLVRTIVRQVGMDKARAEIKDLTRQYANLSKPVQLELKSKGIPETKADAKKMAADLNLAAKPRKALITFVGDAAKAKIKTIGDLLDGVGKKKPKPKVDVNTSAANSKLVTLQQMIDNMHGKTVQINVQQSGGINLGLPGSADGSTVPKTGRPYADRHLYLLADGEEVVSNRFGQADRNRPLLKAINAGHLAGGGTAGVSTTATSSKHHNGLTGSELSSAVQSLVSSMSSLFGGGASTPGGQAMQAMHVFAATIKKDGGHVGDNFGLLSKKIATNATQYDRLSTTLQNLVSTQQALIDGVKQSFTTDVFNQSPDLSSLTFGGGRSFSDLPQFLQDSFTKQAQTTQYANIPFQLTADSDAARKYADELKQMRKNLGKGYADIAGSDDKGFVDWLSHQSAAVQKQYGQAFASRDNQVQRAAVSVGAGMGPQLAAVRSEMAGLRADNKVLLKRVEDAVHSTVSHRVQAEQADLNGAAVGKAVNGVGSTAKTRSKVAAATNPRGRR